jgi:hypothetical protein
VTLDTLELVTPEPRLATLNLTYEFEPEQTIRAMLLPKFFVEYSEEVLASSVTTTCAPSK